MIIKPAQIYNPEYKQLPVSVKVFVDIHYGVLLNETGVFAQLLKYINTLSMLGFCFEQTQELRSQNILRIWFYTDKFEIEEGQNRQVEIKGKIKEDKVIDWEILPPFKKAYAPGEYIRRIKHNANV